MPRTLSRAAAALVGCALLAGCLGVKEEKLPQTGATLEGTITYGTEPVHYAQVMVSGGGQAVTGKVGEDGRYKVENAPLGEVTVAVNTKAAMGDFQVRARQAGVDKGPDGKGKAAVSVPKYVDVP